MLASFSQRTTRHLVRTCAQASLLLAGCAAESPPTDTRGVLDLFISGPLDVKFEGLAFIISGAEAGVQAGALGVEHPVMKLMLPPGQDYSIAVTGLGIPKNTADQKRLACEGSQDFTIRELRTTEIDLNMECEGVGATPDVVVESSCSVAGMLVAPRIQRIGGTILTFADPFPADALVRWTAPNDGVGRIVSTGQEKDTEYGFECIKPGFSEIVVEVLDGTCTATATSAVVCVSEEDATIEIPE